MDENKKPENLQESDEIVVITDNVNTSSSGSPVAESTGDENVSWSKGLMSHPTTHNTLLIRFHGLLRSILLMTNLPFGMFQYR